MEILAFGTPRSVGGTQVFGKARTLSKLANNRYMLQVNLSVLIWSSSGLSTTPLGRCTNPAVSSRFLPSASLNNPASTFNHLGLRYITNWKVPGRHVDRLRTNELRAEY